MKKTRKNRNSRAITEEQIRNSVRKKVVKMQTELDRNPKNTITAQRLAEFKKIHKSKLES